MRVTASRIAKAYLVGVIWLLALFGTILLATQPLDSVYSVFGVATIVRVVLTMAISIAVATAAAGASWWLLKRTESRLHARVPGTSADGSAELMPAAVGTRPR